MRLAARLLDPDAYIICASILKTHNAQVATMSVKNMVLGAPLAAPPKVTPRWSDKRKYHVGMRMMQVNMMLTARKLRPFWGAAVIDGYEGMEGNGPHQGTPVPHRIAMASTDYIAADRVGVEAMGDRSRLGRQPGVLPTRTVSDSTTWTRSTFAARRSRTCAACTACTPTSSRRGSGCTPMEELPSRLGRTRPPEEDLSAYDV